MVKTTLHEARAAAGLSIRIVAEAAGVSESSYGNYEHGFYYPRPDARERLPTAESLRRAAHIRPGDRLRAHGRACTVIGTGPHFFTVAFDRTGARECYAYHAILQKELRRVRNV